MIQRCFVNPGFLRVLVAHRTWRGIQLLVLNGEEFWHLEWEDVRGTKATQQTGEQRVKVHNNNVNLGFTWGWEGWKEASSSPFLFHLRVENKCVLLHQRI